MNGKTLCMVVTKEDYPLGLGKLVASLQGSQIGYITVSKNNNIRPLLTKLIVPLDYIENYSKVSKPSWWPALMALVGEKNSFKLEDLNIESDEVVYSFGDKAVRCNATDIKSILSLLSLSKENFKTRVLTNSFTVHVKKF